MSELKINQKWKQSGKEVTLTFSSYEEANTFLGWYLDGGGESEFYSAHPFEEDEVEDDVVEYITSGQKLDPPDLKASEVRKSFSRKY